MKSLEKYNIVNDLNESLYKCFSLVVIISLVDEIKVFTSIEVISLVDEMNSSIYFDRSYISSRRDEKY